MLELNLKFESMTNLFLLIGALAFRKQVEILSLSGPGCTWQREMFIFDHQYLSILHFP